MRGITHHGERESTEIAMNSDAPPETHGGFERRAALFHHRTSRQIRSAGPGSRQPAAPDFRGLEYFPVGTEWKIARALALRPARQIKIINILGMEEDGVNPGAMVFSKNGHEWRLDAVLESPGDETLLFVMFRRRHQRS